MRPLIHPIPYRAPVEAFAPLAADPWAVLLASDGGPHGRWSYILTAPHSTVTVAHGAPDPWAQLQVLMPSLALERQPEDPPFMGGIVGLACYELAQAYEILPQTAQQTDWPDLVVGVYLTFAAYDHDRQQAWVIAWSGMDAATALAARLGCAQDPSGYHLTLRAEDPAVYTQGVRRVVDDIRAGEMFQANISRAWTGTLTGDPYALFTRWRTGPAPFGAYLNFGDRIVASNSPERFLSVSADGIVESRPIKGTRPRGDTPQQDAAYAHDLETSEKDRAENVMIVDLMRNDLARVCTPGSVQVPALCKREVYPHVQHLVSSVTGQLRAGQGVLDLMRAAFPAGSVTGAPKIRAMAAITQHEGVPRGPYCGSVLWWGLDGACDSSVLIRTAACVKTGDVWAVTFRAGGGITAQSDPMLELAETEVKAHGFLQNGQLV
jgi:para-aminobenzoate synthetase component 1